MSADALASDLGCFPTNDQYVELVQSFKVDGFEMCVDLCAVDYLEHLTRPLPEDVAPTRFEVVVNLLSLSKRQRVRIRVQAGDDEPRVPSLFRLYPGTEAMEREAFDLFGVLFDGHPDLTRILMPEDWEGHPLRRDYAVGKVPVQFKEAPGPR
ncbi:MAG: NADH-quinone oxidoreductase subunit C [Acidimicrobiales bacterium]